MQNNFFETFSLNNKCLNKEKKPYYTKWITSFQIDSTPIYNKTGCERPDHFFFFSLLLEI